jgi:sortase B
VQSPSDNTFYLDHNSYGDYEYAGAIFTENLNAKDFTDPNTVIYGHNMKNGSMFQNLHLFEDRAFMEEHPTFEIYLPDKILTYQVFAAYNYDDRHLLQSFDFKDSRLFELYLEEIRNQRSMSANIDAEVAVTAEDKIVTLSTCNGINDQRYLVQGVLLSEQKVTVN